ncbi:ATP-binding protein [Pseudomonas sp. Pseusp97]|uniref:ATP-binding protein n=1 Tax=Pseudomonas sp. Pseusp97 TaxID=3243065 RepID=UPI0039A441F7
MTSTNTPNNEQFPSRLTRFAVAMMVLVLSCVLGLFALNLFQRVLWEQTSVARSLFLSVLERNSTYDFYSQRAAQTVARSTRIAVTLSPPFEHLGRTLQQQPGPIWVTPEQAEFRRSLFIAASSTPFTVSPAELAALQRFAHFERSYWGAEPPALYSAYLDASTATGWVIPAPGVEPLSPYGRQVFTSLLRVVTTRQEELRAAGATRGSFWVGPFADPVTGARVISCVATVAGTGNTPGGFIITTMTAEQFLAALLQDGPQRAAATERAAFFNYRGEVVHRGLQTQGIDLTRVFDRISASRAIRGDRQLDHWLESGRLVIASTGSLDSASGIYAVSLRQALAPFGFSIAVALAIYLLMLWGTFWCASLVRRHVIRPLHANAQRMRESEAFNRAIVETAPVGLRVVRLEDSGLQAENGMAHQVLPFDSDDSRNALGRLLAQAESPVRRLEFQATGDDAQRRDLVLVGRSVRFSGTDVLLCVIGDVTRQNDLSRALDKARALAEQANREKSQFLAIMSHEIRTPLYAMLGTLEMLGLGDLEEEPRQQVRTIQESSGVLLQILNDLLDYFKVEAGQMHLELAPFDPVALVEAAVRAQLPIARRKGLELSCEWQPDLPWLLGDRNRVRQVLDNLLSNALKFTEAGSVQVCCRGEPGDDGRYELRLSVTDTGIGIDADTQSHLFEPFVQGDNTIARRYGGTGLGLSICSRLLEMMQGQWQVHSEAGEGSCFSVRIPLPQERARTGCGLDLPPVVVLAEPPSRAEYLCRQVSAAGAPVQLYRDGCARPDAVLLVATPQKSPTPDGFAAVLRLSAEGPLQVERRLEGYLLSLFSLLALPEALCAAAGTLNSDGDPANPLEHGSSFGLHVLVVEDHPYNQRLLRQQLNHLGCRVEIAQNGEQGLEACRRNSFDLVLSDVHMPVMDGYEFARRMHAESQDLPIIGLTASTSAGESQRCLKAGMNLCLSKPIFVDALAEALRSVLPTAALATGAEPSLPDRQWLFSQLMRGDLDSLYAAMHRGDLRRTGFIAHRIRGALVQARLEEYEEALELCREIEAAVSEAQQEVAGHVEDLGLYLEAYLEEDGPAEDD